MPAPLVLQWGSLPHDPRAVAFYQTGRNREALEEARKAAALSPWEARLNDNVRAPEKLYRE